MLPGVGPVTDENLEISGINCGMSRIYPAFLNYLDQNTEPAPVLPVK